MILRILGLLGLTGVLFAAGAYSYFPGLAAFLAGESYRWEAVNAEVAAAPGQQFSIRLIGPEGIAVKGVVVDDARLDMAPEGMAAMDTPLTPETASEAGTSTYRADFTMAGRWALHVKAKVPGQAEPVIGEIIFIATDPAKKSGTVTENRKIVYYRNPMGLPDTSPVPKKDSMGMDYIPVYEDEVAAPAGTIRVSLDKVQRSGVKTEVAARRKMGRIVRVPGIVEPDESRVAAVTARFNGFIEDLFVAITGHEVKEGEPLALIWIESPEILQKQSDYLLAVKSAGGKRQGGEVRLTRFLG